MKKSLLPFLLCILVLAWSTAAFAQAPNLGTTATFALFTASGAFNNTGAAVVTGDVGTSVGAFNAFPPGTLIGQTRLPGSTQATQAATDVTTAYNSLTSVACGTLISPILGNGQVLTAGVYCQTTAAPSSLTGTLTLNGPGTYIIKLNSALTTAAGSAINLTNGACINDVFFQVNGAVDLGTNSFFRGTILANGAISLASGATLEGRGLSIAGAISISDNIVTAYAQTMAVAITSGATCNTATNLYTLTGSVSLTAAVAGTLTISDGSSTTTVAVTSGQASVGFSLPSLQSGTGLHTVIVTGPGCSSASATYNAPVSCTTSAPVSATLSGIAYTDNNTNGTRDGGDTPISGVVVTLLNATSSVAGSATTGPSGSYSFTGLTSGVPYSLSFTAPSGYSATSPGNITGPLTLTSGENKAGVDVGYRALTPTLTLGLFVDRSIARAGTLLTYALVVTNSGTGPASNLTVRDSTSAGMTYVANSATVPAGTTFTPGTPNTWFIPGLGAGQSLTLTFQTLVDQSGILYNTASIPGDTLRVCTSVPVKLCPGDQYVLSVPAGSASYRWFKDGVLIVGQTTNELTVSEPGSYSLGIDAAGSNCPNFSCCPFIVEADTLPVFVAVAIPATCISNSALSNGQIRLSGFNATYTFQYSAGLTFDSANALSGAPQLIPATGIITNTLTNPVTAQAYTVRVTNSAGCFTDVTVVLTPTICTCPVDVCVPFVVRKTKGVPITR
ncbi:ice-binding family protein [uncultured Fibrella sp.]|uniref:ice-binding family protein n=1 Tax=uncultured Fibrella sp. TaxID=1284596 RepID=UPI0035CC3D4F